MAVIKSRKFPSLVILSYFKAVSAFTTTDKGATFKIRYLKGVPFPNGRYRKRVPFLSKMVYKVVRVDHGAEPPRIKLCRVNMLGLIDAGPASLSTDFLSLF